MERDELIEVARPLRARGLTPREIARALGISQAEASSLVRALAAGTAIHGATSAAVGGEPDRDDATTRCWVSPGWTNGLKLAGHRDWPTGGRPSKDGCGIVAVLVAAPGRRDRFEVSGYLLDTWCLGVKNALGPDRMRPGKLEDFRGQYFGPWRSTGIPAPISLARHLVHGAVDYARSLGFEPHRDFRRAEQLLGKCDEQSAIRFGKNGKPYYVEGPHDDAGRVLATLDRSVGPGGYHFLVSAGALEGLGELVPLDDAA